MIDKSSLLKSQGSLYLEFISKDGLFHKLLCDFARISHFLPRNDTNSKDFCLKKSAIIVKNTSFLDYRLNFVAIGFLVALPAPLYAWNWHRIGITLMQNDLYKNHWTAKVYAQQFFKSYFSMTSEVTTRNVQIEY